MVMGSTLSSELLAVVWFLLRALDEKRRISTKTLELKYLKKITSWNGFLSRIAYALIRRFSSNALNKNHKTANNSKDKDEPVTIWLSIPYIGEKTSQLLLSFKRKQKLRKHLKNPNTQIRIHEKTTKLCFYTTNKDKVPLLTNHKSSKNSVVLAASHPTLAKLTKPFLSEHMNTLYLIKRARFTNIYARANI